MKIKLIRNFITMKILILVWCCKGEILKTEKPGASKESETAKKPGWAVKLHELLHDQWDQSHSPDYLSKITNVHPVTISKYFINYFGCAFGEYMRKLKISHSLPLIKSSKYSLTDVAS